MGNKDFLICVVLSAFLFFAVKFFWKCANGGFNNVGVMEWMIRGFSFGLGLAASFFLVLLVFKLVAGD